MWRRDRSRRPASLLLALLCASGIPAVEPELDPSERELLAPSRVRALGPDQLIARLGLARDAVVADVGAGPGLLTLPLARAVPPDKPMLEASSNDLVLMCQVDHHLADRVDALAQAAQAAHLRITDEWKPSPLFLALELRPLENST